MADMSLDEALGLTGAEAADDSIHIDVNTREVTVPESQQLFGVESDENVEVKHIVLDGRYNDGTDLSSLTLRVNWRNANGGKGSYLVTNLDVTENSIAFDWVISRGVVAYKGTVYFIVCAFKVNSTGKTEQEWNSSLGQGTVLEGLEVTDEDIGGDDTVNRMLTILQQMNSVQTAAKNSADAAAASSKSASDTTGSIKDSLDQIAENKAAVSQLKEDLGDLSVGDYIIKPIYRSGKIDPTTGEEVTPYDTARISEKLNFDNYESVTVGSTVATTSEYWLYVTVFEFDSDGNFVKKLADTDQKYTIIPTKGHLYVIQWWFGGSALDNRLPYTKVSAKSLLNKADKEQIYSDLSARTKAKLDLPDELFIVKGETLELFKYGMYYTDTEFLENQYNVRVVNIDNYVTQYDDKIFISCPASYSKPILQGDNDLALFQLIDTYGKVIEQKRVKIFVADKSVILDSDRNIMYLGDSFTGMGYRTQEIANLISQEPKLSKTKLIGKFSGQGTGNKFTGTGGYSWANYAENPNTLPSAYPNNYLWDADSNQISMKYLVDLLGENHLEYVVILLGWNDYESGAFASSFSWDVMKQRAKRVIGNIHNYYPNCKIILESYHYMYPYHRKSYGNSLPQVRQNKYVYDLNRFYQEIANEYDYVKFLQMSIQIDVIHNMGFEEEKVNKRNNEKIKYCKDVVHPADIGFYQYSDAEFATLLYLMQ